MSLAASRVKMHKEMTKVTDCGGTIYKISSDALYFSLPISVECPLEFSQAFGCFNHIYGSADVVALLQLGVHMYCVLYNRNGQLKSETKAAGLALNHLLNSDLNFKCFSEMAHKLISEQLFDFRSVTFNAIRKKATADKTTFTSYRTRRTLFSRNLLLRRKMLCTDSNPKSYVSLPYGM